MVALIQSFASASRMGAARMSFTPARSVVLPRTLRTSAIQLAASPTGSEANVHAEKTDADPATLQKETAKKAQREKDSAGTAAPNEVPTNSEEHVHADKHGHDPLPDHKKASNTK